MKQLILVLLLTSLSLLLIPAVVLVEGCMRPPWPGGDDNDDHPVPEDPGDGNGNGSENNGTTEETIILGEGERQIFKPIDGVSIQINPESVKYECPTVSGKYPDPLDCHKYYECLDWKIEGRDCPVGLAFDEETAVCVNPEKVPRC